MLEKNEYKTSFTSPIHRISSYWPAIVGRIKLLLERRSRQTDLAYGEVFCYLPEIRQDI